MGLNINNAINFIGRNREKYEDVRISDIVIKNKEKEFEIPIYDKRIGEEWGHADENGAQGWWSYDYDGQIDDEDIAYDNPYTNNPERAYFKYKNGIRIEQRYYNDQDQMTSSCKYNDEGKELETITYFVRTGKPSRIDQYVDGSIRNKKTYECSSTTGDCKLTQETIPGDGNVSYTAIYYGYNGDQRYPKQKSTYPDGRRFSERIVYHPGTDIPQRVIQQVHKDITDIIYDINGNVVAKYVSYDNGHGSTTVITYDKDGNAINKKYTGYMMP